MPKNRTPTMAVSRYRMGGCSLARMMSQPDSPDRADGEEGGQRSHHGGAGEPASHRCQQAGQERTRRRSLVPAGSGRPLQVLHWPGPGGRRAAAVSRQDGFRAVPGLGAVAGVP